jgi:hypothetical protein
VRERPEHRRQPCQRRALQMMIGEHQAARIFGSVLPIEQIQIAK